MHHRRSALFVAALLSACGGETTPKGGGDVTPEVLAAGGDCPAPAGAGTAHSGAVDADETWSAAGSPHLVQSDLRITATVTLEPCARVLVGPGITIEVGTTSEAGRLVAVGSADADAVRSVTFDALDGAQPWGQLYVAPMGSVDLAVAALLGGGGGGAALRAMGTAGGTNDGAALKTVRVRQVLVERSEGHGAQLDGWAAFTDDSDTLWIRASGGEDGQEALRIEPGVAASLPTHLDVSGNLRDEIRLETVKAFLRDDTLVSRGVPYRLASTLYVAPAADGGPVTLSVEAGVELRLEAERSIVVGSSAERMGALVAEGTSEAPITFTSASATPAAGDWGSLYFRYYPLSGSRLGHARVGYAGGESGTNGFGCGPGDNDAAVIILGQGAEERPPAEVFIQDTTFEHIGGTTVIVSGWSDAEGPNFATGNTFGVGNPDCSVSRPRRTGAGDVCDGGRRDSCWP